MTVFTGVTQKKTGSQLPISNSQTVRPICDGHLGIGNTAALEISGRMLDTACRTHAHCVPQWLRRVSAALFDRGTAADFRIAQHILATSIATTR
jgi:hypothetical protein